MSPGIMNFNQGRSIMKKVWLCAALLCSWAALGFAQTTEELINDGKNPENVLTHSMGYDRKSYSPLKQINKSNIKRLVPIWNASMMNDQGELAQPTVYNGVMYAINGKWTFAIDVETGRQIWRTPTEIESGITRAAFNRGGATLYNSKAFRPTLGNHLVSLDLKTRKHAWSQKFPRSKRGFSPTGGPTVAQRRGR